MSDLDAYASDLTEAPPHRPDAVVTASTVEEVIAIVRECAASRTPLVPVVANTNVGGLAIPEHGGVMLDLRPMNRILEVDTDSMYALLEPGVTWGQLKEHLDARHPELTTAFPLSPPEASVVANCLLDGLTTLSLRHGTTAMWINGVEAVLGDGSIVRTGSAAVVPGWWGNTPVPDLTGLFISVQGTTGIVTKAAIRLFPKKKFRRRYVVMPQDVAPAVDWVRRLVRDEICDDIGLLTWPVAKMALGARAPIHRAAGDPAMIMVVDFSSNHADELAARDRVVRAAPYDFVDAETIGPAVPDLQPLLDLPARLDFLLRDGLTWVGTYGPISRWTEGIERGGELMVRAGFPPAIVLRPMLGGHFGVLRFVCVFDKRDPAPVRRLNEQLVDLSVELGFVPYKTPPWVVERLRGRIHPGFLATLDAVRGVMDPAGIFNPGKWK